MRHAPEAEAQQAVPLAEVDVRHGVSRLDAHDCGVHLWRRPEVVAPNLEQVRHAREQLRVGAQTAIGGVARARNQAHGELGLKHEHSRAKQRPVRKQLEHLRTAAAHGVTHATQNATLHAL